MSSVTVMIGKAVVSGYATTIPIMAYGIKAAIFDRNCLIILTCTKDNASVITLAENPLSKAETNYMYLFL